MEKKRRDRKTLSKENKRIPTPLKAKEDLKMKKPLKAKEDLKMKKPLKAKEDLKMKGKQVSEKYDDSDIRDKTYQYLLQTFDEENATRMIEEHL